MFAVVRTGGKQYRVAPGDKIVVEKMDGNAGDKITLGEVLLAGEGSSLKSTDGLTVAAEIIAQAKGDKVTVFKKRRRHNYRRKQGHRQLHTILRIVAIGDHKEEKKAKPAKAATDEAPSQASTPAAPKPEPAAPKGKSEQAPAETGDETAGVESDQQRSGDVAGKPTENPAPADDKTAKGNAPAKKASGPKAAKTPSTENAAPAKAAAKKTPKAK
jgi:large subunit ribosomal protein L21